MVVDYLFDNAPAQVGGKESCEGPLASVAARGISSGRGSEAAWTLRASWEKRAVAEKHGGI